MSHCDINPMINQVEFHPFFFQPALIRFCMDNNIQLEAWSPLAKGLHLNHPVITGIAEKYGRTPAQVILRWDIQHQAQGAVQEPLTGHLQNLGLGFVFRHLTKLTRARDLD